MPRKPSVGTRVCAIVVSVALLAGAISVGAAAAVTPRASLPAIESQVMCVSCRIPLMVAQSPQAERERAYIVSLIERGDSEAQIKRSLVEQYGTRVLALPSTHGFDLAVYLVPAAVVVFALALLALLLPRWRRRSRAQALAGAGLGGAPLSVTDAARLEADRARFD